MTFESELRKEIEHLIVDGTMDTWKDDFEDTISAIKSLISKYAPKERFLFAGNVEANKGYNLYRAELFKEIGL